MVSPVQIPSGSSAPTVRPNPRTNSGNTQTPTAKPAPPAATAKVKAAAATKAQATEPQFVEPNPKSEEGKHLAKLRKEAEKTATDADKKLTAYRGAATDKRKAPRDEWKKAETLASLRGAMVHDFKKVIAAGGKVEPSASDSESVRTARRAYYESEVKYNGQIKMPANQVAELNKNRG